MKILHKYAVEIGGRQEQAVSLAYETRLHFRLRRISLVIFLLSFSDTSSSIPPRTRSRL